MVANVRGGSLAESIRMQPQSVIQYVDGQQVNDFEDLGELLRSNLGRTVDITWVDKSYNTITQSVSLPPSVEPNRGVLGVDVTPLSPDPQAVLDRYTSAFGSNPLALLLPPTMQPTVVPYSDIMAPKYESSVLGSSSVFASIANLLFWSWFINFNVGIFNALPIGPLDGGQMYGALIEKRAKSAVLAKNANMLLTLIMVAIVAAAILIPYVPF
jgi:membrane-associated protease RseP (regulator of RpoE activity)